MAHEPDHPNLFTGGGEDFAKSIDTAIKGIEQGLGVDAFTTVFERALSQSQGVMTDESLALLEQEVLGRVSGIEEQARLSAEESDPAGLLGVSNTRFFGGETTQEEFEILFREAVSERQDPRAQAETRPLDAPGLISLLSQSQSDALR